MQLREALDLTATGSLRRIAGAHGLPHDASATRTELIERLVERLQDAAFLSDQVRGLSSDERQALLAARSSGGAQRGMLIDHDHPGAVEALVERGLLFRVFAAGGPRRGEVFAAPDEVLALLPEPPAIEPPPASAEEPAERRTSDPAFSLFCLASVLARHAGRPDGHVRAHSFETSTASPAPRLHGEVRSKLEADVRGWSAEPGGWDWDARWEFLGHLAQSAGLLVHRHDGALVPGPSLAQVLDDPPTLADRLLRAYVHDRAWSELAESQAGHPHGALDQALDASTNDETDASAVDPSSSARAGASVSLSASGSASVSVSASASAAASASDSAGTQGAGRAASGGGGSASDEPRGPVRAAADEGRSASDGPQWSGRAASDVGRAASDVPRDPYRAASDEGRAASDDPRGAGTAASEVGGSASDDPRGAGRAPSDEGRAASDDPRGAGTAASEGGGSASHGADHASGSASEGQHGLGAYAPDSPQGPASTSSAVVPGAAASDAGGTSGRAGTGTAASRSGDYTSSTASAIARSAIQAPSGGTANAPTAAGAHFADALIRLDEAGEAVTDRVQLRRALLEAVAQSPVGAWISVPEFSAWLQRTRPLVIREQLTARALLLLESAPWSAVELPLLRYVLLGPLYWLGSISTTRDGQLVCRRGPRMVGQIGASGATSSPSAGSASNPTFDSAVPTAIDAPMELEARLEPTPSADRDAVRNADQLSLITDPAFLPAVTTSPASGTSSGAEAADDAAAAESGGIEAVTPDPPRESAGPGAATAGEAGVGADIGAATAGTASARAVAGGAESEGTGVNRGAEPATANSPRASAGPGAATAGTASASAIGGAAEAEQAGVSVSAAAPKSDADPPRVNTGQGAVTAGAAGVGVDIDAAQADPPRISAVVDATEAEPPGVRAGPGAADAEPPAGSARPRSAIIGAATMGADAGAEAEPANATAGVGAVNADAHPPHVSARNGAPAAAAAGARGGGARAARPSRPPIEACTWEGAAELIAPPRAALGTLLEAERYLVLNLRGRPSRYHLVQSHVAAALGTGGSIGECRALLAKLTRGPLPDAVIEHLTAWERRYGALSLRPGVLLEARSATELDAALADERVRQFVRSRPGATVAEVAAADVLELAAALRESDHLPRVDAALRLASEPRRAFASLVDEQVLEFLLVSLLAFQTAWPDRLADLEGSLSLIERLERQFPHDRLIDLRRAASRLAGQLSSPMTSPRSRRRPRRKSRSPQRAPRSERP